MSNKSLSIGDAIRQGFGDRDVEDGKAASRAVMSAKNLQELTTWPMNSVNVEPSFLKV